MSGARIPMADPAAEYRALQEEIDAAVSRVLSSGHYVLGPEGEAFERELAAYVGAPYGVGCNSGTDALRLALAAAGIGPGDEVVLPAFTFVATAAAVVHAGAVPVFADIDPIGFTISRSSVERRLSPRTRAVIAVHLYGRCAALKELDELCKERSLVLVEDCAQALGAEHRGRRAGSWGDFGCFSFYPTKTLAAPGDAGLVTTGSRPRAEMLQMLRHHGSRQAGVHERVGWNSRLDELHAAVLRVKLRHLDAFNAARRRLAERYRKELGAADVVLPDDDPLGVHVYQQFTIRSAQRETLRERLAAKGIASSV
ncbi:MAG TPA: DegT/DnrJ/EryC1/StrS family aminotransferase, partial [Myxococcota bacterium]|nr:DegT/DnrJ/EryC1/StrS family aminotransferase [Myxococcota bacterium]